MRRELEAGTPPDRILSGVFAKYGDQYRAVPGFSGFGLLAWVAPLVFLLTGLLVALRLASTRRVRAHVAGTAQGAQIASEREISDSEKREIERELARLH
jgi:cytochrome c-type biogenesis protein CcmH/NrfF